MPALTFPLAKTRDYSPAVPPVAVWAFWRTGYSARRANPWGAHLSGDMPCPVGTPVVLPERSIIVATDRDPRGDEGRSVIFRGLETGWAYCVMHLRGIRRNIAGERHPAGYRIGRVGETGRTSGPHLHIEAMVTRTTIRTAGQYWAARADGPAQRIDLRPFLADALKARRIVKAA